MSHDEARAYFEQELAKTDPDPGRAMDTIAARMNLSPLEVLLAGVVPAAWEAGMLTWYWVFQGAIKPSDYAGTATLVKLFERVGFVSDFPDVERPTTPLTIYRGTTEAVPRHARGISWTIDIEVARRFSHCMDHWLEPEPAIKGLDFIVPDLKPTVWCAEIPPEGVLGLFYEQNELEVVVNPRRLRKLQILEQSAPIWPPEEELSP
ncbi:MAG: hypothetical protein M3457_20410 [Chloroflexota bacterium]|nr:hypothetical protein [Chloroflexota bacterium]